MCILSGEKDLSALSKQYSSRDLPGHTKLKYREQGQGNSDELRSRDFRDELERRERDGKSGPKPVSAARRAIEASSSSTSSKRQKLESANLDADDPDEEDSDNSDNDSDDDTAALLAELNKIKRERAVENEQKDADRKKEEERIRMENILSGNYQHLFLGSVAHISLSHFPGNPLLNYSSASRGDLKIKRRWDDDVVFKNCARSEPNKSKTFINDSLRSEFHKKFMEKYIK